MIQQWGRDLIFTSKMYGIVLFCLSLCYYVSWKFHLSKMKKWPVFMTY